MNEIDKLIEKVIADWDKRYLMKMMDGGYGYFVKRKRLIQMLGDQLTKYGQAVKEEENYKYLLGHLMYVSEWQPELIKEAYSELSQEDKDLFKKKIELIQKLYERQK